MKRYLILFTICLFILIPVKVKGLEAVTNISCDKEKLSINETSKCTVYTDVSGGTITGFKASFSVPSGIELSNVVKRGGWSGSADEGGFNLSIGVPLDKKVGIGTFVIKAVDGFVGTADISLTGIEVTGNDGVISVGDSTVSITAKSTNSLLSSLTVEGVSLKPSFSPDTTRYEVVSENSEITISGEAEGKISGLGKFALKDGDNNFKVVVTAEAGNKTTYIISVKYNSNRSSNNDLKDLSLSVGSIKFYSDRTNYDIEVDSSVSEVTVTSSLADEKAKYVTGSSSFVKNLDYGVNSVVIGVEAEDGSVKTYTIKINRKDERSSIATLSSIKLSTGTIIVEKKKYSYTVMVNNDVDSITIKPITTSSKASYEISGNYDNLEVGDNLITILVISEKGNAITYKLKVVKAALGVVISNDSSLKSLTIRGHEIEFNPKKLSYEVKIRKENSLKIKAIPNDPKANVIIRGNDKLKDTSIVNIVVTAEDGTSTNYQIKIIEKNNTIVKVPILIISICILLVVVFVLKKKFIKRKKKD